MTARVLATHPSLMKLSPDRPHPAGPDWGAPLICFVSRAARSFLRRAVDSRCFRKDALGRSTQAHFWQNRRFSVTSRRRRSSRARLSMVRIFSAASLGTLGLDTANSQQSSMAVRVSRISQFICSARARRANDSSRLRRRRAKRTSRSSRSIPVRAKLTYTG